MKHADRNCLKLKYFQTDSQGKSSFICEVPLFLFLSRNWINVSVLNVLDLALINRPGGLYGRILTEVASTDRMQWGQDSPIQTYLARLLLPCGRLNHLAGFLLSLVSSPDGISNLKWMLLSKITGLNKSSSISKIAPIKTDTSRSFRLVRFFPFTVVLLAFFNFLRR